MNRLRGNVFTPEGKFVPGEIVFDEGVIREVNLCDEPSLSLEEKAHFIIPGLIDIHTHGSLGHDVCDGDFSGLEAMADFLVSRGTTSFFPTTMTLSKERLVDVLKNIKTVGEIRKEIKGVYLEGPFISYEKCGAQNKSFISKPDGTMMREFDEASGDLIRFVAVAPEVNGAMEFISENHNKYVISLAHTASDYESAKCALDTGASQVTHLLNGMREFLHREPGVMGAALDSEGVTVELIADGNHVHPSMVRAIFRLFGAHRVILISDSMEATGMPDGGYELGGQAVTKTGNLATLSDGTIAGSVCTLFDCVISAVGMGISLEDAIISATMTPAIKAGIYDRVGSIEPGKEADIVVFDKDLNILEVI